MATLYGELLPEHANKYLYAMSAWLTRYNHNLMIVVSIVFGLFFLTKGAFSLLSY